VQQDTRRRAVEWVMLAIVVIVLLVGMIGATYAVAQVVKHAADHLRPDAGAVSGR
jgi:hypothetical protein